MNFTFFITINGVTTQFYPSFKDFQIISTEEGLRRYLKSNGSLVFIGEEFDDLDGVSDTVYELDCEIKWNNVSFVKGKINLSGDWDYQAKVVKLKYTPIDNYTKPKKYWEKEVNVLYGNSPVTLSYTYTITQFNSDYIIYDLTVKSQSEIIAYVKNLTGIDFSTRTVNGSYFKVNQSSVTYYLKRFICPFPVTGFIWSSGFPNPIFGGEGYTAPEYSGSMSSSVQFTRFRKLTDIIQSLLKDIDSNFSLDIDNSVSRIKNIYIAQKSDIIKYNSTNGATILNISLKRLFEILYIVFGFDWYCNGNSFLLNRVLNSNFTIDLTNKNNIDWTKYKKIITTNQNNVKNEIFEFEQSSSYNFGVIRIDYDILDGESKSYPLNEINNDISYLIDSKTLASDDGICIVETNDNSLEIPSENGIVNSKLSRDYLLTNNININRPYQQDLSGHTFVPIKTIKPEDIKAPYFSGIFDSGKVLKAIHNMSNDCAVEEITLPFNGDFLTYKLKYK